MSPVQTDAVMGDRDGLTAPDRRAAPVIRQNPLEAEGRRIGRLLTMPAQLLLLFIFLFPTVMVVYLSLTDWSPFTGKSWIYAYRYWYGLGNYADLLVDSRFWESLWRTVLIMVIAVPAQFILGFGLAILFTGTLFGKRVLYTVLLTPMMVVPAVAGYMFFMLFQSNGPINDLLSSLLGMDISVAWLSRPNLAMIAVIITEVWQWTPLMFLILLAGLTAMPQDQIMAADMLGASWGQVFWRIVLPRMRGVIVIALALRFVECFKIFDTLFIMTGGGPGVSTETISVFMYKVTFLDLKWSYVSAIGLVVVVALSVLAVLGMKRIAAAAQH